MSRTTKAQELLDHANLTTVGLLVEAHAGLGATLGHRLEVDHGLSGQRFEVLLRLMRSPDHRLRMSDLAAQTTLSASGLTRVVDRLVASGLVERSTCPSDRRGSYAALTPEGATRILAAIPDHVAQISEILERTFTPHEIDAFSAMLRRLRDAVNPEAERASRTLDCEPVSASPPG
ncbi:MAG: MarR family transcriptional regulator [Acidimicrobiales bacterium]